MSSKFQTPKKELSIAIVNELTRLTTAIKSCISEGRKVQVSINFRLKTTQIIALKKAFYMQGISIVRLCDEREYILVTSRNGNRKIMLSIRIMSRPPTRTRNNYRKDFSQLHFDNETGVQEKQQGKNQQSCKYLSVACLTVPSSNQEHQARHGNSIPCFHI